MDIGAKVALNAAIGGTAEVLGGGKFANGAVTGAYVMMFNHLLEQDKSHTVSELEYPPAVNLMDDNWQEQLVDWIIFIEENELREVPITKIINFESARLAGRQKYGNKWHGSKAIEGGYISWSTPGPDPYSPDRRLMVNVNAAAMSDGRGGWINWSFIFEGYPIYGGASNATNLFQVQFSNFNTFSNYYKNIYPNADKIEFVEVR